MHVCTHGCIVLLTIMSFKKSVWTRTRIYKFLLYAQLLMTFDSDFLLSHQKDSKNLYWNQFLPFLRSVITRKTETEINVTEFFIDLFDVWLYTIIAVFLAFNMNKTESEREDLKYVLNLRMFFSAYQLGIVLCKKFLCHFFNEWKDQWSDIIILINLLHECVTVIQDHPLQFEL